jgi:inorganic phosphate transporter, PiT family
MMDPRLTTAEDDEKNMTLTLFIFIVILALIFGLSNGLTNGGGIVATVITTRAMEPLSALILVAVCEVLGLFVMGNAVATTLAHNVLIFPSATSANRVLAVLASAFLGGMIWYLGMWYISLPTSSSHAMVGGMMGAAIMEYGTAAVHWPVIVKILAMLAIVPILGVVAGFVLARLVYWLGEFLTPAAKGFFRWMQILALAGVAMAQGSNDGQKTVAMILMGSAGLIAASNHPYPVALMPILLLSGIAMAIGVMMGSRRIMNTLGKRLYRVDALQGFCAEMATMVLVGSSSYSGYPMPTSQVLSTSVLGTGIAVQPRDVRWNLVGEIGAAWVVTIPAAGLLAAGLTWLTQYVVS